MRLALWAIALALPGCDDTLFPSPGSSELPSTPDGASGWCGVEALFADACAGCHSSAGALGGLDLETDPYATVVGVAASTGDPLVAPGDPEGSFLLKKLEGTQGASGGGPMPPTGPLDPDRIARVRQWIADGASPECEGPTGGPTSPPVRYHPEGWAEPESHGPSAKLGQEDCRSCHGADLEGGAAPACSSCHPADWKTTCTFCHGSDGIAAPPEDIDDNAEPATISFPAHRLHLSSPLHRDWGCAECHLEPQSALAAGHLFDDPTPGRAELTFGALAGAEATWDPEALVCSNLYCHGDGQRSNGRVTTASDVRCGSCHPAPGTDGGSMSGRHEDHLEEDLLCAECHPTVDPAGEVIDKDLHVDGEATVELPPGMRLVNETCTGSCHGEEHEGERW